jgi:hypothetical protein
MTTIPLYYQTITPWVPFMFSPNKLIGPSYNSIPETHNSSTSTNTNANTNTNTNISIPEIQKSVTTNTSKCNSIPEIQKSETYNKCNSIPEIQKSVTTNTNKCNSIPEIQKSETYNKCNSIPEIQKSVTTNTNKCNSIPEIQKSVTTNTSKCNSIPEIQKSVTTNTSKCSSIPEIHKSVTNEYFVYNVVDSLFWLLFIGAYGVDEYNVVEYNFGKRIIDQKQQLIQMVSTMPNKQIREITGRKLTIQSVRDILASIQTSQKITTESFPLFALYHNTDIFIFDRVYGTYCEYEYKNATTIPIILYKQGNTFSVERTPMKCIEADYATHYIRVNEPGGCIEPITHYTKPQLVAMLTTLQQYHNLIPLIIVEDCNKKELYDHILRFIGHSSVVL